MSSDQHERKCRHKSKHHNKKHSCCKKHKINPSCVEKSGYTIRKSGYYVLGGNVDFAPYSDLSVAITIAASNVTLDLCQKVIRQTNTAQQCTGIVIETGLRNIKIFNGTVTDFSQLGMCVTSGNNDITLGSDDTTLSLLNNGRGSKLAVVQSDDGVIPPPVIIPILQAGLVLGTTKYFESRGFGPYYGLVSNVIMKNVICERNSPRGCLVGNVTRLIAENCSFSENQGFRPVGADNLFDFNASWEGDYTASGLSSSAPTQLFPEDIGITSGTFNYCHFDRNYVDPDPENPETILQSVSVWGGGFSYSADVTCYQCTFNGNASNAVGNGGVGTWPLGMGGGTKVLFDKCDFSYNFSTFAIANHISATANFLLPDGETGSIQRQSDAVIFRECTVSNNLVQVPAYAAELGIEPTIEAIEMFYVNSLRIENCTVTENKSFAAEGYENVEGHCKGIRLSGSGGGSQSKNIVIKGNNISGNYTNCINSDALSYGIEFYRYSNRAIVEDNFISGNPRNPGNNDEVGIYIDARPEGLVTFQGINYNGIYCTNGPGRTWAGSLTAPIQLANPINGGTQIDDLTGKIAIGVYTGGSSSSFVRSLVDVGAIGVLLFTDIGLGGTSTRDIKQIFLRNLDYGYLFPILEANQGEEMTFKSLPSGIMIDNNTLQKHYSTGIYTRHGFQNVYSNNTVSDSETSIYLSNTCHCTTVKDNTLSSNNYGIFDNADESDNFVISNLVVNTENGIEVNYPYGPAPTKISSLTTGFVTDVNNYENHVILKGPLLSESERSIKKVEITTKHDETEDESEDEE